MTTVLSARLLPLWRLDRAESGWESRGWPGEVCRREVYGGFVLHIHCLLYLDARGGLAVLFLKFKCLLIAAHTHTELTGRVDEDTGEQRG